MKKTYVITIGRSFGSRGREIGEKLAARLQIGFYDKNLILLASKKSGLSPELLDSADEKLLNRFLDPYASMGASLDGSTNDRLYRAQSEVIKELASKESCVIVGRQADKVLSEYDNCLKIFVYSSLEQRIKNIMERHHITEQEAKKVIRQMDKIRRNYYSYFSDGEWDAKDGKDLMIDSGCLGVDKTVDYLEYLVRLKFDL